MEPKLPELDSNPASGGPHGPGVAGGANGMSPGAEQSPPPDSLPAAAASPAPTEARRPKLRPTRRNRLSLKRLIPAWGVSVLVHVAILMTLAAATVSSQDSVRKVLSIDSALALKDPGAEIEQALIYADPNNQPRTDAIGDEHESPTGDPVPQPVAGGGGIVAASAGNFSKTPAFRGAGSGARKASAEVGIVGGGELAFKSSALRLNPAAPALDIGGRGMLSGDPSFVTKDIGEALDQLAREILRHLKLHKLTVIWLFDESTSMKDDQKVILEKFDRVTTELKLGVDQAAANKKALPALSHVIVGFGEKIDPILTKPTPDVKLVSKAIQRLNIDVTGIENTMQAIKFVVDQFSNLITKERKLLLVLVTDESGDDGANIEEARQALKSRHVPLYVVGRQSLFGFPFAHHRYVDQTTGDTYYPVIRRGPESADIEMYQWDGLYDRWDEQPSGFAPFELARLTKESGGLYFLLPSEEFMRVRQREQAYSIAQLKEYMPEYENRMAYVEHRNRSPLRRELYEIVSETRNFRYRREFPIEPQPLVQAAAQEGEKAAERLQILFNIQARLEQLAKVGERETERRWRAHYQLMHASTVAFQVKAYEYQALMASVVNSPPSPAKPPAPGIDVFWVVDHSKTPLAPPNETAKKYAEARRLLEKVIADHPKTPWADLAKDVLDRGLSVRFSEWHRSPKYTERMQYVPKY